MNLREKYVVETEKFKKETDPKNSWERTRCNIYEVQDDGSKKYLGNYERNYHSLYNTWEPFVQDGKVYALCSPDYTTTSVIALPECEIVATEGDWNCFGFCPTGFYVPQEDDENVRFDKEDMQGKFGFVCGCVWGDDNGWKIQFLDLSEIKQGKVIRDDRFGYTMLDGGSADLAKAFEYIYVDGDDGEIDIELKGIKTYVHPLKRMVGKNDIDPNALADRSAEVIVDRIQYFLKEMADKKVQTSELDETSKKYIRQILYNTVVEVAGEDE